VLAAVVPEVLDHLMVMVQEDLVDLELYTLFLVLQSLMLAAAEEEQIPQEVILLEVEDLVVEEMVETGPLDLLEARILAAAVEVELTRQFNNQEVLVDLVSLSSVIKSVNKQSKQLAELFLMLVEQLFIHL
jgi:hypothetical protein